MFKNCIVGLPRVTWTCRGIARATQCPAVTTWRRLTRLPPHLESIDLSAWEYEREKAEWGEWEDIFRWRNQEDYFGFVSYYDVEWVNYYGWRQRTDREDWWWCTQRMRWAKTSESLKLLKTYRKKNKNFVSKIC